MREEAIIILLYDTGFCRSELSRFDLDVLDLKDQRLRTPPGIQKDSPNEGCPDPETFELDPEDDLRTVRTLKR